ncbi:MAG: hypothetical protein D8M57_06415 [Candidatus Scalindua sp. AMX11]|nr:MAG: hypothetical protein DWQ00_13980 [Candidatus Scalindua sp.]NOG85402.1 UvrD-helicase domain-containing protein [Planctomycetota bacterium]RZV83998.1 MAG: hypothetical protein EX341_08675 [Candidatus Scalindua sp. SCAELEC01]TDE65717.1 MAG: hypothetical protein D8M57_06415 [Candidatus Scalindua sp. AMX11]GJQ58790.1 MAG: hypothetical protein SCALA701_15910 [Candidatus Scalindua sp.]
MESKLTPSQEKGVKITDRDLCMVAGPGSGKTSVLVERFVNLVVTRKASINEILTLTFTEKAANEMKMRVANSFEQKGMQKERQEIEFAFLSTIHSFCARLLRENAIEAGVDPQFSVMDELEANRIKEYSLEETLEKWVEKGSIDTFLNDIFWQQTDSKRGRIKSFKENLILLYEKIRNGCVPVSDAVITPDLSRDIMRLYETILELIGEIKRVYSEKKITPKSREKIRQVLNQWNAAGLQKSIDERYGKNGKHNPFSSPLEGGGTGAIKATGDPTVDNLTLLLLNDVKAIHSSINLSVSNEVKHLLSSLREELETLVGLLVEGYSTRIKMVVRKFLMDFETAYGERKRSESFVDFTDLEEKTIALLQGNEYIRAEIQHRFKFILVDEFQDTSRLQKSIIDLIRGKENLFVVGDAKQSIYGFRNADVEIFQDMQRDVVPGSLIRLNENFRSRPQVLDFINHLFGKLWPESVHGEHEDCNAQKDTSSSATPSLHNSHQLKAGAQFSEKSLPSIEIVVVDGADKIRARRRESTEIANRIKEIVEQGEIKITNQREEGRKVSYRDFAILFRSTTDIKLYEQSLLQSGIPYYVVSGRGFFNTTEIKDLINFLKVVESPLDEIDLAAVLKSPFVGIDDDALFWLSDYAHHNHDAHKNREGAHRKPPKRLLYQILTDVEAIQEIDTGLKERIVQFTKLLHEVQDLKPRVSLWQLISFILKKTEFQSKMLLFSNGKKRYANLLKLVDLCKSQEDFEPLALRDFIRIVEGYKFREIRESEAPVESEEDDVVKLITTHSAKGLEFSIVIVADLDRDNTRPSDYFVFSKKYGISFKTMNPSTSEAEVPLSYEQIRNEISQKELQESKRLLFVAMTRAQEHLILTGGTSKSKAKGDKDSGNWLSYVVSILCLDKDHDETLKTIRLNKEGQDPSQTLEIRYTSINGEDGGGLTTSSGQRVSEGVKETKRVKLLTQYKREIETGNKIKTPSPQKIIADAGKNIISMVNCTVPADQSHYLYTVTEILTFHFCPQRYCFNSILGLQGVQERDWSGADREGDRSETNDDEIPSNELGNIVHRVFKRYHFLDNSRKLKDYIERELLITGLDPCQKSIETITNWVLSFYRSSVGEEIKASKRQKREISFIFHCQGFPIRGQIDLFYVTDENSVKIVDYKANNITVDEIPDKIKHYRIQMQLYARALEAVYGERVDEAILYFLVPDRSVIIDTSVHARRELDTTLDKFFSAHKNGNFTRVSGRKCRWCEFEPICK